MMARWLWLSAAVVVLDQVTKRLASHMLVLNVPVPVLPLVNLTLAHNTGAAFSFLHGAGGWQRWFFSTLAIAVSVGIVIWMWRLPRSARWTAASLGLILGGAVGNLWDRLLRGHVVDFVDVYHGHWHWPAFNLADSCISIGVVMLLMEVLIARPR